MTALDRPYWIEARVERREGWDAGAYPFNLPVVRDLDTLAFHPRVTFLVGENGSGKSTLIEALAVAWGFNAEGGSRNFNFSNRASHSPCTATSAHPIADPAARRLFPAGRELLQCPDRDRAAGRRAGSRRTADPSSLRRAAPARAVAWRGVLRPVRQPLPGRRPLHPRRARGGLSPQRQLSFLVRLHELVLARSQFIIATHSPILLGYPDAWIYQATERGLERIEYEDTEHYQVTRNFLNRRQTFLDVLLAQDDEA
jgi:predicted ATPase